MFSSHCNIDKTDRINRTVIGLLICIAVLIGMGKYFFIVVGNPKIVWLRIMLKNKVPHEVRCV
jgi:hypothetical protein